MRHGILIVVFVLCRVISPAGAEIVLPAIYSVAGVSGGDVLNVRSGPSMDHPVIGGLPNGAEVEVTARSGDVWARILHGEGNGWVAVRYLQAQNAVETPEALFCGGTEPFWSLTLERDGALTFTELEGGPSRISPDWRYSVTGRPNGSFAAGTDGWALDFLRTGGQGAYLQGCCRMLR